MNRKERRRAEAAQRAQERRLQKDAEERAAATIVPESRKADIARVVRSIDFVTGSGTCFSRAITGGAVLSQLGIDAKMAVGSMLYRAGPDELADTLAFCGPGNAAFFNPEGHGDASHIWLTVGNDLVDFSVGDWRLENHREGNPLDRLPDGTTLPQIQWTAPPMPEFWWQPLAPFTTAWQPIGTPTLGTAWYKRAEFVSNKTIENSRASVRSEPVQLAISLLRERAEQLVSDWQSGAFTPFAKKTFVLGKALRRHGRDVADVLAERNLASGRILRVPGTKP
jgi:hypothetical protein